MPVALPRLKRHYFLLYAIVGCISPYLPVYLHEIKALPASQIGLILAAGQTGILIMPPLMTAFADRHRLVAPLLIGLFTLALLSLSLLTTVTGFAACLVTVFFINLAMHPQVALADGLYHNLQANPRHPRAAYPNVRLWGTVGFIAANLLILAVYPWCGLPSVPFIAAGFSLLALGNVRGFPQQLPPHTASHPPSDHPTRAAWRLIRQPRIALLLLGLGCVFASYMAYYGFYPLYLTQQLGLPSHWVGSITSFAGILEIAYLFSFERLLNRLGLPGLIILGISCGLARVLILAFFPTPFFAIAIQLMHGLTVIGVIIAPALYLNTLAPDHARNSVQGLYSMLVVGLSAILGNILAGRLAELSLLTLFRASSLVCLFGLSLIALSFYRSAPPRPADR